MFWFPTLVGTLVTTVLGLLVLVGVARSVGNRLSTFPLVLRTALAVCVTTWIFAVAGSHGVGFAALPSIAVFFMNALGPLDADGSMFGILVLCSYCFLPAYLFITAWISALPLSDARPSIKNLRFYLRLLC